VKDQPKLAIKHLLSVVKPAQLKEVCESLLLDQIELRKDFYGFVKHLSQTRIARQLPIAQERAPSQETRRQPEAPPRAIKVGLTQDLGRVLPRTVPQVPPRARLQSFLTIRHAKSTGR
jgi:hypothetical protein